MKIDIVSLQSSDGRHLEHYRRSLVCLEEAGTVGPGAHRQGLLTEAGAQATLAFYTYFLEQDDFEFPEDFSVQH